MRLTPAPLHLLIAMSRGATLHECVRGRWNVLEHRQGFDRVHTRGVNALSKLALIERTSDATWRVSDAGYSWLASNGIVTDLEKPKKQS